MFKPIFPAGVRPATVAALCLVLACGFSDPAHAQVAKKPVAEPKGLAVVFDASESTCGYLVPDDAQRKLLGLIKKSVAQRDPETNHRVYLLKQQSKNGVEAQRDIVEAPANLQALAELLAGKTDKQGQGCAPFNGVGSNLELIFDPQSATAASRSMLLVTDGQFLEKDREKFVQGFVTWAADTVASGAVPYAGVALVEAPFAGRYFSVTEPATKLREAGYLLPQHDRPLMVFWFARGEAQLPRIKELISTLDVPPADAGAGGFQHHLLPLPASGPAWLDTRFAVAALDLPALVGAKPAFDIKKFDAARSSTVIAECLRTVVTPQGIVVETPSKCADGKPLFDGVSEIVARFKLSSFPFYAVRVQGDAVGGEPSIAWRLTSKAFGDSSFRLQAFALPLTTRQPAYRAYSMDSDHCTAGQLKGVGQNKAATVASPPATPDCLGKLNGKTYQLDVLLDQMLNRREAVSKGLLESVGTASYVFSFRARK